MQVSEVGAANEIRQDATQQIASWAHPRGLFLIAAGMIALGVLAQRAPAGDGGSGAGQIASHAHAIPVYLTAIVMDWALLYFCWGGVSLWKH
jgi:hypothetical protein